MTKVKMNHLKAIIEENPGINQKRISDVYNDKYGTTTPQTVSNILKKMEENEVVEVQSVLNRKLYKLK